MSLEPIEIVISANADDMLRTSRQVRADFTGISKTAREFGKTARESAAAFQAFDRARDQIDAMRAALDPAYAATRRYETALAQLDAALEMGVISGREHASMMDLVSQSYLRADAAQETLAASGTGLGGIISQNKGAFQNLGFQIQDFAVQVGAGTSASQALAQQLPQLLGGFGLVGIAVGTLASVGIPVLGAAFEKLAGTARTFEQSMSDVESSISRLNELGKAYSADGLEQIRSKYGEVNAELLLFIQRQREAEQAKAMEGMRDAVSAIADEMGAAFDAISGPIEDLDLVAQMLQDDFGLTVDQVRELRTALEEASQAQTFDDQAAAIQKVRELLAQSSIKGGELYQQVLQAEDAMRRLAAAAPAGGWLEAAIQQAKKLGQEMWDAVRAKASFQPPPVTAARPGMTTGNASWAQNTLGFTLPGADLLPPSNTGGGSGSGSGSGGGGAHPLAAQLEALRDNLVPKSETLQEQYQAQQEMLEKALQQKLLTHQEYAALIEAAQSKHQEAMAAIDVYRYGSGLQQASQFFSDMAGAMQGGNEDMMRIARTFGAAEALINAWRAASQTLADPSLPFFAKLPAAMSVLASGMNMMNAINSGSRAGGGGGGRGGQSAASSAAAAPAQPLEARLTGIGMNDLFTGRQLSDLLDRLSAEAGDRGFRLMVAQ